jgi:hypothetical protein
MSNHIDTVLSPISYPISFDSAVDTAVLYPSADECLIDLGLVLPEFQPQQEIQDGPR